VAGLVDGGEDVLDLVEEGSFADGEGTADVGEEDFGGKLKAKANADPQRG
jgi:hypothetical protein